jgi:hypothetical protein
VYLRFVDFEDEATTMFQKVVNQLPIGGAPQPRTHQSHHYEKVKPHIGWTVSQAFHVSKETLRITSNKIPTYIF